MRKMVLMALMAVGIVTSASAQRDDLYFVPKKKKVITVQVEEKPIVGGEQAAAKTLSVNSTPVKLLEMDEDTYNRRGSYIMEKNDTILLDDESQNLTRVDDGEGWVNGFEGSDSDYEYAMRIVRFRNPRYAIPVSSPLYWDVVYGGALWPSWEWNVYDDGMYAYVVPTSSNWYYWDYYMNYPLGWSAWGNHWYAHHGYHWGLHWGNHYYGWQFCGHVGYAPWYSPGWHHGPHHGYYPGVGRPGWGGGGPKVIQNNRTPGSLPSHRGTQVGSAPSRVSSSARVVAGRTGGASTSVSRPSGTAVRSSSSSHTSSHTGSSEVVRRSTGSSSVNRSSSSSNSGSGYTSRSSSGSSGTSYSRPSSTRSSLSSTSRSSSPSSSTSSRSSSYSSGTSSRSSYSSGSSYGGNSSRSSGSFGGSSSRSSGSRR